MESRKRKSELLAEENLEDEEDFDDKAPDSPVITIKQWNNGKMINQNVFNTPPREHYPPQISSVNVKINTPYVEPDIKQVDLLELAQMPLQAFQVLAFLDDNQRKKKIEELEEWALQLCKQEDKEIQRGTLLNILGDESPLGVSNPTDQTT
eukprot:TRINITY_DN7040_c0_g1_i2.p1 TRINITY_DN7040_c0_g1~~TRINITY_DN7040_c0_g1_i2.p1  ORF type:complete len:151 (-),score=33.56 TRINITY_DN7040_c0_g1_i2:109-561(-)